MSEPVASPVLLGAQHRVEGFASGVPALDAYLTERALADQSADKSRTYVATSAGRVIGYYSLAAGSVEPARAARRAAAGQGGHPIPVVLLGRLAVDELWQGRGIGTGLVFDALERAVSAAETIGARAVLVHALEGARTFYLRLGFEPSPTDPLHLMLLMKDVRATLR